ncbi:MAG: carbonic anhydrase [Thermoanaerobaculaceae bacterium]|jgi:carbonic anhydrase
MVAILEGLLAGNRRFVAGTPAPRDHDRERKALVSGQRPVAAVLTCSDSRIAIEDTFDAPLGTLFGVKTAGSTVDFAVLGSIEYSVSSLDTPLVIVMGHEGCGAVRAAFDRDAADGALGTLIRQLRRNIEGVETYDAAIHANARATVRRLLDGSALLMATFERGKIAVVPVFYRLAEGLAHLLG